MQTTPSWLERAALRSSEHSLMLGWILNEFVRIEGMSCEQTAAFLGCDVKTLQWLALCRKPEGDAFAEDVRRIAERFAVDASNLAQLIRRTEAVLALRQTKFPEDNSLLLAARDRDEDKKS